MVEKDKVRTKIIQTAGEIFRKYGYRKTTMEDIASAVKKGKSSIYYYFKSKEDIYRAVVLREGNTFRKNIMQAIGQKDDPKDKLKKYVLTRMNTFASTSNFHNALKNRDYKDSSFIERLNVIYAHEEVRLFRIILQEGVESGYFKIYDIELAAVAIVMAMRGMESKLFEEESNADRYVKQIDDIIHIIFYGIVNR